MARCTLSVKAFTSPIISGKNGKAKHGMKAHNTFLFPFLASGAGKSRTKAQASLEHDDPCNLRDNLLVLFPLFCFFFFFLHFPNPFWKQMGTSYK